ncbi:inactive pancreatic lipase-related protein 1-like, partial [Scomber scombrus]
YTYRVKVTLDGPSWPNPGRIYVTLAGNTETTMEYRVHMGILSPGRVYEMIIDAEVDVGEVTEVKFRWNNHIFNPIKPKYGAAKVELQRGKDMQLTEAVVISSANIIINRSNEAVTVCK